MNRPLIAIVLALVLLGSLAPLTEAQPPSMVSYQGSLYTGSGSTKTPFDGTADFKFAFVCGGGIVWNSDLGSAQDGDPVAAISLGVQNGIFSVMLGDASLGMPPITGNLLGVCTEPMLRVWVDTGGGVEQLPDQPVASSAFALRGETADTIAMGQGLLIPQMTTTERDALINPEIGLQIYNTTTECLNFYIGTGWREICGDVACPFGLESCSGNCVDWNTDVSHCGACDNACPPGATCDAGACNCPSGLVQCGNECVDLDTDIGHCGACGQACGPNGICTAGACECAFGYLNCNGDLNDGCEVDWQNDANNCGACGVACPPGNTCIGGTCVSTLQGERM